MVVLVAMIMLMVGPVLMIVSAFGALTIAHLAVHALLAVAAATASAAPTAAT
jgi:hypothetical protein